MGKTSETLSFAGRLKLFFTFFDSRWEDLTKDNINNKNKIKK